MTVSRSDPFTEHYRATTAHGHLPFDVPFITEIRAGLYQGGVRPGLILPPQIKHVISLYQGAQYRVRHPVTTGLTVRMNDALDQSLAEVERVAQWAHSCWRDGPTLIHCEAGLNRSSLITARVLMINGRSADEAIASIRYKRSYACLCNPAFESYLRSL